MPVDNGTDGYVEMAADIVQMRRFRPEGTMVHDIRRFGPRTMEEHFKNMAEVLIKAHRGRPITMDHIEMELRHIVGVQFGGLEGLQKSVSEMLVEEFKAVRREVEDGSVFNALRMGKTRMLNNREVVNIYKEVARRFHDRVRSLTDAQRVETQEVEGNGPEPAA